MQLTRRGTLAAWPRGTYHCTVTNHPRLQKRQWSTSGPAPVFCSEPSTCPVCDAPAVGQRLLFLKQWAKFVECNHCGFVFINPRPKAAWLASRYEYYAEQYFTDRSKLASAVNATPP